MSFQNSASLVESCTHRPWRCAFLRRNHALGAQGSCCQDSSLTSAALDPATQWAQPYTACKVPSALRRQGSGFRLQFWLRCCEPIPSLRPLDFGSGPHRAGSRPARKQTPFSSAIGALRSPSSSRRPMHIHTSRKSSVLGRYACQRFFSPKPARMIYNRIHCTHFGARLN